MFLAVVLRLLIFFTFTTLIHFFFLYASVECTETINLTKNGFFKEKVNHFYHYRNPDTQVDFFLHVEDREFVQLMVVADKDKKNFVKMAKKYTHELETKDLDVAEDRAQKNVAENDMPTFHVKIDKQTLEQQQPPHQADPGSSNTIEALPQLQPKAKTYCQIYYRGFPWRVHKCPPNLSLCPHRKRFFALVKNINFETGCENKIIFFQDIPLNKEESSRLARDDEVRKNWQLCKESADTVQKVNFLDARRLNIGHGGIVEKADSSCWNFGKIFQ